MLIRFWFEFEFTNIYKRFPGLDLGCGITAYNYDDAILIMSKTVFKDNPIPPIRKLIENIDVSTLDAGHVLPNMVSPIWRGIWFPGGYEVFK